MRNRSRGRGNDPQFNPKRRLRNWNSTADEDATCRLLVKKVRYKGSPAHKRDPGDFDLSPPAAPRQNATLCDEAGVLKKARAQQLLKNGVKAGLISQRSMQGYPAQIWTVDDQGVVFEAELENSAQGDYHGYPLPLADPFRLVVLKKVGLK